MTKLGVGPRSAGPSSLNIMLMKGWNKHSLVLCQSLCRSGWRVVWLPYGNGETQQENKKKHHHHNSS